MNLLAVSSSWRIHYCKRSANKMANLLAKLDDPIITNVSASLPPQVLEIYIEECD